MTTNCYPVLMDRFTPTNRNDPPPSDYKPDRRGYTRLNPPLTPFVWPLSPLAHPFPPILIAEQPDCRCSNEHGLDSVDEDETGEPHSSRLPPSSSLASLIVTALSFSLGGFARCNRRLLSRCVKSDREDVRHNAGTIPSISDRRFARSPAEFDIDFGFSVEIAHVNL